MIKTTKRANPLFRSSTAPVLCIALCVGCASGGAETSSDTRLETQAIIGGTATSTATWPWAVRVFYNGAERCGGSLIAPDWVLSAAHCLTTTPGTGYQVLAGSTENGTAVVVGASEVFVNPNFVDDEAVTGHFDMGLIHLVSPVTAGTDVGFIRPAVDGDAPGTNAVAIGRGMTNNIEEAATYDGLRQVSLPVVASSSCNNVLPIRRVIYPDELCAGFSDGHAGVCFGDSGSALMEQRASGTWELIGSPSGVTIQLNMFLQHIGCQSYGIFARTSAMVNWIRGYVPDPAWLPGFDLLLN